MDENEKILERLVRLETDVKWIKDNLREVRRDVSKSRWELVAGIIFVIAIQVILRFLLG